VEKCRFINFHKKITFEILLHLKRYCLFVYLFFRGWTIIVGWGIVIVEVMRSHSRHTALGRNPLDEWLAHRREVREVLSSVFYWVQKFLAMSSEHLQGTAKRVLCMRLEDETQERLLDCPAVMWQKEMPVRASLETVFGVPESRIQGLLFLPNAAGHLHILVIPIWKGEISQHSRTAGCKREAAMLVSVNAGDQTT